MKITKLTLMMLIAAMAMMFYACSDDSGTNPENPDNGEDYYKMEVGNWWIYQEDELDSTSNVIEENTTFDTTRIVAQVNYEGENALLMTSTYEYEGELTIDSSYMVVKGSQLYAYFEDLGFGGYGMEFGAWLLMADFNQNEWVMLDTSVQDVEVDLGEGQTATLSMTIKMTGKKLNKETVVVDGQNIECQKFEQHIEISGTIDMGQAIPFSQKVDVTNYFGKNVGFVKSYSPPTYMELPVVGKMWFNGSQSMLLKYSVK
jgi:hypothetical protein